MIYIYVLLIITYRDSRQYVFFKQKHVCNDYRKTIPVKPHRTSDKICLMLFQHIHYQMDINLIDGDKRDWYVAKNLIKRLKLITAHNPFSKWCISWEKRDYFDKSTADLYAHA